jgi:hypothetical protein
MTDDDIKEVNSLNYCGHYANSPFYGSALNPKREKLEEEEEEVDISMDVAPECDEMTPIERFNLELLADLQEFLDTDFSDLELED